MVTTHPNLVYLHTWSKEHFTLLRKDMLSTKLVGVALEKPGSGFAPIDTVKPPQQYFPTLLLLRMRRTILRMTNNIYFSTFFSFTEILIRRMSGDAGDNFGGWLRADGIVESHRIPLKNIITIICLPCALLICKSLTNMPPFMFNILVNCRLVTRHH